MPTHTRPPHTEFLCWTDDTILTQGALLLSGSCWYQRRLSYSRHLLINFKSTDCGTIVKGLQTSKQRQCIHPLWTIDIRIYTHTYTPARIFWLHMGNSTGLTLTRCGQRDPAWCILSCGTCCFWPSQVKVKRIPLLPISSHTPRTICQNVTHSKCVSELNYITAQRETAQIHSPLPDAAIVNALKAAPFPWFVSDATVCSRESQGKKHTLTLHEMKKINFNAQGKKLLLEKVTHHYNLFHYHVVFKGILQKLGKWGTWAGKL